MENAEAICGHRPVDQSGGMTTPIAKGRHESTTRERDVLMMYSPIPTSVKASGMAVPVSPHASEKHGAKPIDVAVASKYTNTIRSCLFTASEIVQLVIQIDRTRPVNKSTSNRPKSTLTAPLVQMWKSELDARASPIDEAAASQIDH